MANTAELQLQLRRGAAAAWTSADPIMVEAEFGYETDTGYFKVGDGVTAWASLTYDWNFGGDVYVANNLTLNGDLLAPPAATVTGNGNDVVITASDGGATSGDGGSITLNPGGVTSGILGVINLAGDTFITGDAFEAGNYVFNVDQTITASEDGYTLTYDDATGEILLSPSAGGGMITGKYRFDTAITTGPATGKIRFDAVSYGTVTELFISSTTDEGGDATNFLAALGLGDQIYFQETTDAGTFSVWQVASAVTDETGWFRIPVTAVANGVFPDNNDKGTLALSFTSGVQGIDWKSGTESGFHSLGFDDNATEDALVLANQNMILGDAQVYGGMEIKRQLTSQRMRIVGGTSGNGGGIDLYGTTYIGVGGDVKLTSSGQAFFRWYESIGELEMLTGIGTKDTALTIDASQNATFAGDVTVQGTFTSLGIDDNATSEVMQINTTSIRWGAPAGSPSWGHYMGGNTGYHFFSSGTSFLSGAAMLFYGNAHASLPGDAVFNSDNNTWMHWDESQGSLTLDTGVGVKTTALTLDTSQNATFAGDITLKHSTAPLLNIGSSFLSTGNAIIKLGAARTSNGSSYIDFIGDTSYTQFGLRLIRTGGANSSSSLIHRGTGNLEIHTDDLADILLKTNSVTALTIDSLQNATFAGEIDGASITASTGLYGGRVFTNATVVGNSGFTCTNPSTGTFVITHNLGNSTYGFSATPDSSVTDTTCCCTYTTNTVTVYTRTAGVLANRSFLFTLIDT